MPKFSELPTATKVAAADLVAIVQGGVSKQATGALTRALKVTALTSSAGVLNIDCSLGDYFTITLTENVTSITFSNLPSAGYGQTIMLWITQHASSAKTMTFPSSFDWEGGTVGVISTTLSARDTLALSTLNAGTNWDATLSKARS